MEGKANMSFQFVKGTKRANGRILWLRKCQENFLDWWFIRIYEAVHLQKSKSVRKGNFSVKIISKRVSRYTWYILTNNIARNSCPLAFCFLGFFVGFFVGVRLLVRPARSYPRARSKRSQQTINHKKVIVKSRLESIDYIVLPVYQVFCWEDELESQLKKKKKIVGFFSFSLILVVISSF